MLSIIIITKNEGKHISKCLASVNWADEVIVFDCGSIDNTVEICRNYTNNVFVTSDWPGFGIQKQRALDKATKDWVLSIDADEEVTPSLREEIIEAIKHNSGTVGFKIPRLSKYCGKDMKHGGCWPDYVLRLFKREKGKFSPDLVHEQVIVNGAVAKLTQPLLHEAFLNISEVLYKIDSYSTLSAQKMAAIGKKTSLTTAILKALWMFMRCYFFKAGFLDGKEGFMLAVSNAEGTYYKYMKLLELNSSKND